MSRSPAKGDHAATKTEQVRKDVLAKAPLDPKQPEDLARAQEEVVEANPPLEPNAPEIREEAAEELVEGPSTETLKERFLAVSKLQAEMTVEEANALYTTEFRTTLLELRKQHSEAAKKLEETLVLFFRYTLFFESLNGNEKGQLTRQLRPQGIGREALKNKIEGIYQKYGMEKDATLFNLAEENANFATKKKLISLHRINTNFAGFRALHLTDSMKNANKKEMPFKKPSTPLHRLQEIQKGISLICINSA